MTTPITIRAIRPDGVTMYWADTVWTSHASDAKDWRTHEAAAQAAAWDRELRHMRRYGFDLTIQPA